MEDGQLEAIRLAFDRAYDSWQQQAPLVLADGEALRLREQTNTYPTDMEKVLGNIEAPQDLALPSLTDAQGLPALELLLYAPAGQAGETIYADSPEAAEHAKRLADRLVDLHTRHLTALESNRDAYVANDGNSATASIDRTVNDYIFYYEKFLRAGKVGIPAGVFSDTPLPGLVESRYRGMSKGHFLTALDATQTFFSRDGLSAYLDATERLEGDERLSVRIRNQFERIGRAAQDLPDDFQAVARDNPAALLGLYDELQQVTILLKVDMLQTLNINVDYIDADGD